MEEIRIYVCNKLYTYLYHHMVVLDKYIHSNLVSSEILNLLVLASSRIFKVNIIRVYIAHLRCVTTQNLVLV